ncbi:MAG: Flp pilus assembly complex ATPase component TadA [Methyloprofundus sp.]|nr:Flp pilus assembly complex ATPase component TadA [Methyloprofundus sp.]
MTKHLDDLEFSDLYIGENSAYIRGPSLNPNPQMIDFSVVEGLRHLCEVAISKKDKGTDFAIEHDGTAYRGSLLDSIAGSVFVLRRQPSSVKKVSELIKTKQYIDALLTPELKGLVLIVGEFGNGKSWTASGIVAERLEKFGGVAATLEDPPELPLHGQHGSGICFQTHIEKDGFAQAIHSASRWAPDILYFSELRDADSANEALKAAQNGKLSLSTIHGNSPISGIERLFNLATSGSSGLSNHDDISSLMANGLAIVLHQKLERDGDHVIPKITWLSVNSEVSVKSLIKDRKWSHLQQEINQQFNQLLYRG